MELSGSEVVALMAAAVLLNAIGFVAWKRGAVGQWHLYAAGLVVVALLAGDEHNPFSPMGRSRPSRSGSTA